MWNIQVIGGQLFRAARLQWAPTLTSHDPNPPINLEDPPVAPPTLGFNNTLAMMGAG